MVGGEQYWTLASGHCVDIVSPYEWALCTGSWGGRFVLVVAEELKLCLPPCSLILCGLLIVELFSDPSRRAP